MNIIQTSPARGCFQGSWYKKPKVDLSWSSINVLNRLNDTTQEFQKINKVILVFESVSDVVF